MFHGKKDDGKVIGRVTQSCCGGCCTPKLNILSRKGDRELIVKGPCVIGDMCGVKFDVLTDSKKTVRGRKGEMGTERWTRENQGWVLKRGRRLPLILGGCVNG